MNINRLIDLANAGDASMPQRRFGNAMAALKHALQSNGTSLCSQVQSMGLAAVQREFGDQAADVLEIANGLNAASLALFGVPLVHGPLPSLGDTEAAKKAAEEAAAAEAAKKAAEEAAAAEAAKKAAEEAAAAEAAKKAAEEAAAAEAAKKAANKAAKK